VALEVAKIKEFFEFYRRKELAEKLF